MNKQEEITDLKILADRVVVRLDKVEDKTASGIIIPESVVKETAATKGTVINVGTGRKGEPMIFKLGDRILFGKYSGEDLEWNKEKLKIMRQTDIWATIEEL